VDLIDLHHLGHERVIGSWVVGDVLIDPGPASCLSRLLEGLAGRAPRVIALTHIHLDHAGATGSLLRRFPDSEVWVHERGTRHLIDPHKLLASATRLYGADMERLWGEVLPVPAERIRSLTGGERLDGFEVAYTPGHASHHVSYLHESSGTAFCGDVAGVRIRQDAPVLAPTPPPDIDLPAWSDSLAAIESWQPAALVSTHFGRYEDVTEHLRALRESLSETERLARSEDEEGFARGLREQLTAAGADAKTAAAYQQAMPAEQVFAGMRRYLEKAQAALGSSTGSRLK
jgi:glyoxylase-like metal-dependent hydrolase (beta-lactamase superfamily II)